MTLTYGSLFSGVGGFDMGFDQAGFECVFQVEWDKHCQSVLNRHWPSVPKWSDVQDVNGAEVQPCDVLIFGSPCQDLSVAGKRAGIDGGRSSMFFEAIRIIKEMQNATGGMYPRAAVWENVPGALSSNRGEDFQAVLNEMVDCGSHLTEWAVLDAQHFGVPQRRRRIFLVAVFDPAIASRCPDPLFPVREGRRGDYQKGIEKGQEIAGTLAESIGSSQSTAVKAKRAMSNVDDDRWEETDLSPTLNAFDNGGESRATVLAFTAQRVGEAPRIYEDSTPALLSRMGTGGNNTPMVCDAIPIQGTIIGRSDTAGPQGPGYGEEDSAMYTLDTVSQHGVAQPIPIQDGREIEKHQNGSGIGEPGSPAYTLDTRSAASVAQATVSFGWQENFYAGETHDEITTALTTTKTPAVQTEYAVRRLTPLECERLMGWKDDHTRWTADGKEQSDSARYKQCGNGVATPVAKWVAQQIKPLMK